MFCRPREVKSEWSFILPRKISFQLVSKLVEWSPGGPLCHQQDPFQWSGCPYTGQELPTRGVIGHSTTGGSWAQYNRSFRGTRGALNNGLVRDVWGTEKQDMGTMGTVKQEGQSYQWRITTENVRVT
jgi:uncharacterized protein CbrC (UPF0167 family)